MRRMRWLLACGLALTTQQATAADLPDMFLRGSNTVITAPGGTNWEGFYAGGHVGRAWTGTDFANSTQSLIAFMLRNTTIENENAVSRWTTLGKSDINGTSYGAFAGYQTQWEGAVVGIEGTYNRTSLENQATDTMARQFSTSDGFSNNVQVTATSQIRITDYGTVRAKGGWAAGNVMPYGFLGLAMGRADVTRSARVIASGFDISGAGNPPYSADLTKSEFKNGAFAYGYTFGFGVDWAVMQSIFLRAEYEYIQFGQFNDLKTYIQTARIGAGIKF
jgi:outer membrane immunogenic protein